MNAVDMTGAGGIAGSRETQALMNEAKRLVETEIYPRWTNANNVWRSAWAMDTLIDYYRMSGADSTKFRKDAVEALNPTRLGNWWDDFGWIGIAALRMADTGLAGNNQDVFLKIAINAWAYMYGPGWTSDPDEHRIYPFYDVPGWGDGGFAGNHKANIGAPNVWAHYQPSSITPPDTWKRQVQPRFSPGGAWNSPMEGINPIPSTQPDSGEGNYLNPVQNTVTNGLFMLLSLRLLKASNNPDYAHVFQQANLAVGACSQAWKDQYQWLSQWASTDLPSDESLLLRLGNGALFRERVSTFLPDNGTLYWDGAYRSGLTWTGDQGLLLGALRESRASVPQPHVPVLDVWSSLISGVFENTFHTRSYGANGTLTGAFPLPWWVSGSNDVFNATSPGGDDWDYRTGVGVFMRYALQAFEASPSSLGPYVSPVLTAAQLIAQPGFGDNVSPPGDCDAFGDPVANEPADIMIPYVNRLSVLLLASEMSR